MSTLADLLARKRAIDEEAAREIESLKDKSLPLDDRWATFMALSDANLLDTKLWGDGHVDCLGRNITLYDHFYVERHETVKYTDMYENMLPSGYGIGERITQEQRDEWREKVLEEGFDSFEHDW